MILCDWSGLCETVTKTKVRDFIQPLKYVSKSCKGVNKALSIFKVEDDLDRALDIKNKSISYNGMIINKGVLNGC